MAAAAATAYGIETFIEGALLAAKGIYDPTLPLNAKIVPLKGVEVSRAYHTVSVVKGRAYIFGGINGQRLADNAMHIIVLPSSGVDSLDYKQIQGTSASPPPRKKHSAAVIDDVIFIFGGVSHEEDLLYEGGVIWAFDTATDTWSTITPSSKERFPEPRAEHASVATDEPKQNYHRGDVNIMPQAPPDPAEMIPNILENGTYGTLFVGGGHGKSGELLKDLWSFDLAMRTWSKIADPPTSISTSPSLALDGRRLYSFSVGNVAYLDLASIVPLVGATKYDEDLSTSRPWTTMQLAADTTETPHPGDRTGAILIPASSGQGRNYLTLIGGQTVDGKTVEDIWTLQLQPEGMTAASIKDTARRLINKDTSEHRWDEVKYYDADDVLIQESQPGRGIGARIGAAGSKGSEIDGASILIWGGIDDNGTVRSDGLLITIDR